MTGQKRRLKIFKSQIENNGKIQKKPILTSESSARGGMGTSISHRAKPEGGASVKAFELPAHPAASPLLDLSAPREQKDLSRSLP